MPRQPNYHGGIYQPAARAQRDPSEFTLEDSRRLGRRYRVPRALSLGNVGDSEGLIFGSTHSPGGEPVKRSPAIGSALDEFVRLATVGEPNLGRELLRVARRWGPLGAAKEEQVSKRPLRWGEPIASWRSHARGAAAILSVIAEVSEKRGLGSVADWWNMAPGRRAYHDGDEERNRYAPGGAPPYVVLPPSGAGSETWAPRVPQSTAEARLWLAPAVSNWLARGRVSVEFWWSDERPRAKGQMGGWVATWRAETLLGRVACELAGVLLSGRGQYVCTHCRQSYSVQLGGRRPSAGGRRRNYCPACRGQQYRVAKRLWEREHRTERAEARRNRRFASDSRAVGLEGPVSRP
ncbi:MAG: hypothetical protein ACRENX_01200 [Candidatus Dormibacteria bacterium]